MTACVNNEKEIKGGVSHKVLRSVVAGVLAVSMVPTAAFAAEPEGASADVLADIAGWKDLVTVDYTVDRVDGSYTATVDSNVMAVESILDASGNPLSASDYEVVYYKHNTSSVAAPYTSTWSITNKDSEATVDKQNGGAPNVVPDSTNCDKYAIAIVKAGTTLATSFADTVDMTKNPNVIWQEFTVKAQQKELKDVVAFEADVTGNKVDADKTSDTSFKYNGGDLNVAFKMGGTVLDSGDFDIVWTAGSTTGKTTDSGTDVAYKVKDAGTYTAKLTGKGDYTGTVEVTFTVAAVDLSNDEVAIAPVVSGETLYSGTQDILVDGEPLASGLAVSGTPQIEVSCIGFNDGAWSSGYTAVGKYTFRISGTEGSKNITGSKVIDAYVTNAGVAYAYGADVTFVDGTSITSVGDTNQLTGAPADLGDFGGDTGRVFTESAFKAAFVDSTGAQFTGITGTEPKFVVTVEKDGQAATDYTQPGHYTGVIKTDMENWQGKTYAGYQAFEFDVLGGADYTSAKAYATIGDKVLTDDAGDTLVPYTGEGVVPEVVVKMDGEELAEGEDYTAALADSEGSAVESAVEPGEYSFTLTFADAEESTVAFAFTVVKAEIVDVESASDFYALPADGSAVAPAFVGTTADKDEFELPAAEVSVKYYAVEWRDEVSSGGTVSQHAGWYLVDGKALSADELTEAGHYAADVTVLTTSAHLQGGEAVTSVAATVADSSIGDGNNSTVKPSSPAAGNRVVTGAVFEVAETVAFTDVAADAWYADPVYKAKENGYMNGIAGTKLFMPNADITREQVAAVMFNMAGQTGSSGIYFPTRFSDVDGLAWYAEPVSWAAQAGVMNGYAGTDVFGVSENATREEVACIFYNYAKAQGKDVAVEDADAVLAAMADGDTVSDWAKEAVAWAVENGVMGNAGSVWAQNPISRAEVAAMAVNFQPEALK